MPKLTKTYDRRVHLQIEDDILQRVRKAAGRGKVNDWIRQAMREKLEAETDTKQVPESP